MAEALQKNEKPDADAFKKAMQSALPKGTKIHVSWQSPKPPEETQ